MNAAALVRADGVVNADRAAGLVTGAALAWVSSTGDEDRRRLVRSAARRRWAPIGALTVGRRFRICSRRRSAAIPWRTLMLSASALAALGGLRSPSSATARRRRQQRATFPPRSNACSRLPDTACHARLSRSHGGAYAVWTWTAFVSARPPVVPRRCHAELARWARDRLRETIGSGAPDRRRLRTVRRLIGKGAAKCH